MRIVHLTPGTGNFHCGSCLRDNVLIKALRKRGHDAMMVPLYLPLVTDDEPASPGLKVQVGGISLYLQQKLPWFRRAPKWLHRCLDSPRVLKAAVKRMKMTNARDLGEMTLASLQGLDGPQGPEWRSLLEWLEQQQPKPDVVSLSNGLLSGLARPLKERLGVPVLVSLQGEDSFLDTLPEPFKEQAWQAFRDCLPHVDALVGTSGYYSRWMERRLKLNEGDIDVVWNGMDFSAYQPAPEPPPEPVIGYLARMCMGKGLKTLVDTFILLDRRGTVPGVRLAIAGAKTAADEAFVRGLKRQLAEAGCGDRVRWLPNVSLREKIDFLRGLRVLSVPATYGEAFGLYVLEAQACGVPVVQPRHGGFPEVLEQTGGGVLVEPDDIAALADGLEPLLQDPERARELGQQGRAGVMRTFTGEAMAERFDAVLAKAIARSQGSGPAGEDAARAMAQAG